MHSKKFIYTTSAIMLLVGIVALVQDAQAARIAQARAGITSFNQEATTALNGQYMLVQPAGYDYDLQATDRQSQNAQATQSAWVTQPQDMESGLLQGSRTVLQAAHVQATE